MPQTATEAEITEDLLLGGRVRLRQPRLGYRAGMDAALLAAACDARPGSRILEAGCGVGGALIAAAARRPETTFVGVERDVEALELVRQNVVLNGQGARVEIVPGNIEDGFKRLGLTPFDAVMANPPFFDDPGAIRGPHPARVGAYIADGGLGAWLDFMIKAAREGGTITIIHRADRLADILSGLGNKAGSFRVRPIHPFADEPAKRVLMRAVKTGRAPLVLLPPLVLHERGGGKHTPETDAILRGEADISWT